MTTFTYSRLNHFQSCISSENRSSLIVEKPNYEKTILVLLANRFDKNSILSTLPVDIGRMLAKQCIEKDFIDKEPELIAAFQQISNIWDDYKNRDTITGRRNANFPSYHFIIEKLYQKLNINFEKQVNISGPKRGYNEWIWNGICKMLKW